MSYKGPPEDAERYVRISLSFIKGQDDDLIAFIQKKPQRQCGPAIKELMRAGLGQGDTIQAVLQEVRTTIRQSIGEALKNHTVTVAQVKLPDEDAEVAAALDAISF